MQRDPKKPKSPAEQSENGEETPNLDAVLETSFEDKVQRYWNDNKLSLIVTIPLCFILVGAFQGYKMLEEKEVIELQNAYQNAYKSDTLDGFIAENNETLIAGFSALKLANEAYTSEDYQGALTYFKQAEQSLNDQAMKSRASLGVAFSSLNIDESEGIAENARNDLLSISQHSAMGSLIGNVGISIYYPNPLDRLALINSAAQGATAGSITGVSNYDLTKKNDTGSKTTETFDIEIARSSSSGAAFGATFETIALTDANPKDFSSDSTTINVVQAVTYGSTFGAITAGNDPDVGAPAADAVIFKQATKQGAIEGSLNGASLGTGSSEENINTNDLRSRSSIVKAAASTNAQAAADASSSMATKAIRTSTSDMLMLMKKFNINPRLTNPTKIFNNKTNNNEEDEFLFEDNLKVASPI